MASSTELLEGEALIYERSNGIVFARYRDPPHNKRPRWVVGGDPCSFLPNDKPLHDYFDREEVLVNWDLVCKHDELRRKYVEFLEEQDKYIVWETMTQSQ